eukprot:1608911-Rhodomonas_salina.1
MKACEFAKPSQWMRHRMQVKLYEDSWKGIAAVMSQLCRERRDARHHMSVILVAVICIQQGISMLWKVIQHSSLNGSLFDNELEYLII